MKFFQDDYEYAFGPEEAFPEGEYDYGDFRRHGEDYCKSCCRKPRPCACMKEEIPEMEEGACCPLEGDHCRPRHECCSCETKCECRCKRSICRCPQKCPHCPKRKKHWMRELFW